MQGLWDCFFLFLFLKYNQLTLVLCQALERDCKNLVFLNKKRKKSTFKVFSFF